jgi:hypothetical protein
MPELIDEFFSLVNFERKKLGFNSLDPDFYLQNKAKSHSTYMKNKQELDWGDLVNYNPKGYFIDYEIAYGKNQIEVFER